MTIFEDSRYLTSPLVALPDSAGVFHATVLQHEPDTEVAYDMMVSEDGDTFATIAWSVYRDAEQWWRIADLNPEVFYPDEIDAGTLLRVPHVATSS